MDEGPLNEKDCCVAYEQLFGRKDYPLFSISYSGRFKGYNAIVESRSGRVYSFRLSKVWLEVSKEIQIGCVQSLMQKIFRYGVVDTSGVDLYNGFIKNLSVGTEKFIEDDELLDSYERVVDKYFDGFFDKCSIKWGTDSYRTLGHYHYASDTITLSTLLRGAGDLLDFVMYHEMLHKKLSFKQGRHRTMYHSKEFRQLESQFENFALIDKELQRFVAAARRRGKRLKLF